MTYFTWAVGEIGTTYTFTLKNADDNTINLTGKTVTLKYKPVAGGSTTSRTCTVTDAANGKCTYTLVSGDTTSAEQRYYNFEITSSGYLDVVPKSSPLAIMEVVAKV